MCKNAISPHTFQTSFIFGSLSEDEISKYFIYIFLIVNKVKYLLNHLNALCIFFYVNYIFCPLLIFLLDCKSYDYCDSLYNKEINPLF